jgi:hypothetical protein
MSDDVIVRVGDVGTVFEASFVDEDGEVAIISTAVTKTLTFRRPNGSTFTRAGSFTTDGTDGKLEYAVVAGELTIDGDWQVQGYVELASGGKYHAEPYDFVVGPNLSPRY